MTQQRQNKMVGGNKFGDTTWTKIFVGGLAWETHSHTLKSYFQQFGDILEAVVIADKVTAKSKGYGFVTFKNPDSAMKACEDPYPVIDGRRANCNLASFGAQPQGIKAFRQPATPRSGLPGGPVYYPQPIPQTAFAYSAYGYPSYPQDMMYTMNYYNNGYGGPYYYAPGVYYRPFYAATPKSSIPPSPSLPSSTDEAGSSEHKSSV